MLQVNLCCQPPNQSQKLIAGILAIETKYRMLDLQDDNCRLTSFPRIRRYLTSHQLTPILSWLHPFVQRRHAPTELDFAQINLGLLSHTTFSLCVQPPTLFHAESNRPTLFQSLWRTALGQSPWHVLPSGLCTIFIRSKFTVNVHIYHILTHRLSTQMVTTGRGLAWPSRLAVHHYPLILIIFRKTPLFF